MDNQTNESRAAYNAERCKSQRRYQPAADSYGRSVESAVKEDENQGGNADVEAQMIIIEKNPSDALFPASIPSARNVSNAGTPNLAEARLRRTPATKSAPSTVR